MASTVAAPELIIIIPPGQAVETTLAATETVAVATPCKTLKALTYTGLSQCEPYCREAYFYCPNILPMLF